jgi:hypothetical protein
VTLPAIFKIHATSHSDVISDPRGSKNLATVMARLMGILNISAKKDIERYFDDMLTVIGIKADIETDLGISIKERAALSCEVNHERMGNNPVIFSKSHINKIFKLSLTN